MHHSNKPQHSSPGSRLSFIGLAALALIPFFANPAAADRRSRSTKAPAQTSVDPSSVVSDGKVVIDGKELNLSEADDAVRRVKARFKRQKKKVDRKLLDLARTNATKKALHNALIAWGARKHNIKVTDKDRRRTGNAKAGPRRRRDGTSQPTEAVFAVKEERRIFVEKIGRKLLELKSPTVADARHEIETHREDYDIPARRRLTIASTGIAPCSDTDAAACEKNRSVAAESLKKIEAKLSGGGKLASLKKKHRELHIESTGWVPPGDYAADVEKALKKAKPGEVVGPLSFGDRLALFRLDDFQVAKAAKVSDWEQPVLTELRAAWYADAYRKVITRLYVDAKVKADPAFGFSEANIAERPKKSRARGRR